MCAGPRLSAQSSAGSVLNKYKHPPPSPHTLAPSRAAPPVLLGCFIMRLSHVRSFCPGVPGPLSLPGLPLPPREGSPALMA